MMKLRYTRGKCIEYDLRRTQRRSVECRVKAEGITVFAPVNMPLGEIEKFLLSRMDWILEAMERARAGKAEQAKKLETGQTITVCGQTMTIRLAPGAKARAWADGNELCIAGGSPEETLRRFLIEVARERLTALVNYYAPIVGCKPGRITIREQKTRWGSCSSLGNLNFNWRLVLKPVEMMEYVVVHELCHLIHLNHSPAFWQKVGQIMPDYQRRRKL